MILKHFEIDEFGLGLKVSHYQRNPLRLHFFASFHLIDNFGSLPDFGNLKTHEQTHTGVKPFKYDTNLRINNFKAILNALPTNKLFKNRYGDRFERKG